MKQAKVLSASSRHITLELDEHDFQPGQFVIISPRQSSVPWFDPEPVEPQAQQEQPASEAEQ